MLGSTMIFEIEKEENKKGTTEDEEIIIKVYLDLLPLSVNMSTTPSSPSSPSLSPSPPSSPSSFPSYTVSFTPKELRNRIESLSTNLWEIKSNS